LTILEAAKYDPLRAQEIEAGLSRVWWERYAIYQATAARLAKQEERKQNRRR
jgi:hypothetical protein